MKIKLPKNILVGLSVLLTSIIDTAVRCQVTKDDDGGPSQEQMDLEWAMLSANNTRPVYNFGIGSLLSWSSQQYSLQKESGLNDTSCSFAPLEQSMCPATVTGITREYRYCWRYTAVAAIVCNNYDDNKKEGKKCPSVVGALTEIKEKDYSKIRKREAAYTFAEVKPETPLPETFDPDGYYFAWAVDENKVDPKYDCSNTTCQCQHEPMISQAYWDIMIGGILAWDGQLLNEMYTWDLDAELTAVCDGTYDDFVRSVAKMPSLSLAERRKMAIDFVKTTVHAPTIEWADDRACPYTGDCIITARSLLRYPMEMFGSNTGNANCSDDKQGETAIILTGAVGTNSPVASQTFYDYVDDILIEGGWEYGAKNSIHDRVNPCQKSGSEKLGIARTRLNDATWNHNPFLETIMRWRSQYGK